MSLIEVLVSMLVVGLALVTSIAMIQSANRFGNSAEYSSSALIQAQAIIDKIRVNKVGINGYLFIDGAISTTVDTAVANGVYDTVFDVVNMGNIPSALVSGCVSTPPCTPEAMTTANTDMVQWTVNLREALPEGKGIIRVLDANRGSYEVVVMWRNIAEIDANSTVTSNAQGIHLRFSL